MRRRSHQVSDDPLPPDMADLYDYEIDLNADTTHSRVIRLTGYGKKVLEGGCATGYVSRVLTSGGDNLPVHHQSPSGY
jgi:hypothetical protein